MNKRAQITIFIILAIVVVAGVGIYFAVSGNLNKSKSSSLDTRQIESFVQSCIEEVGEDAIYEIGQNGGYVFAPELSTFSGVPYYFYEGNESLISKPELENEISKYVNAEIYLCTNEFENYPDYEIIEGRINTTIEILEDSVKFKVKYPLTISKGNSSTILENFEAKVSSGLEIVYEAIYEIIKDQMNSDSICMSCIMNIAEEKDVFVHMKEGLEGDVLFTITEKNIGLDRKDFEFVFANKYNFENEEE
ncbi:MAG: hypothetical protein KJ566_01605 [Nanoarchaeota archaeon]|nr:hypothetical protein [Nanoarchaeota archaeon]